MGNLNIKVIDTHTEGEPTRIIISGFEDLPGKTVLEKRDYFKKNLDWVRRVILYEPRGHSDQFGAVLLPSNKADFGVFFIDTAGYLDMCGHATIGVATTVINLGLIKARGPETVITFETPAGIVKARCRVMGNKVREVSVVDVPSFYVNSYTLDYKNKEINVDVAFGGNFYVIAEAKDLGIRARREYLSQLIQTGLELIEKINRKIKIKHPTNPKIAQKVTLAMITDEPETDIAHGKNIVIWGKGQFDRSPCGTGSAARVAVLYSKGIMRKGDVYIHESIINTIFKIRILDVTNVGNYEAIIPEITGRAFITQKCEIVFDEDDPVREGFILR